MDVITVQLPEALLSKVRSLAHEEHRSVEDVLADAVDQYAGVWTWKKLMNYGAQRAKSLGIVESDVDRLIAEVRAEHQSR